MRRTAAAIGAAVVLAAALGAVPAFAAVNSQLTVGTDGVFSAKNILLYQKSGTTLYCRAVWGTAFVRLTVLASAAGTTTNIIKNHGGAATIDDLSQGDYLDIKGTLQTGADTLLVNASQITDLYANEEQKIISGTIKSLSAGSGSFVLPNKTFGATTTVVVGSATIQQGVRTLTPAQLMAGDKVLSASGSYDYAANTLTTDTITLYQDPTAFAPRNFQGTVRAISGTVLPATITVSTGGGDYLVYLPQEVEILSKNRSPVSLSRFAVGDLVRFWGTMRQANLAEIDAGVLRDLNF